jgi:hypothetical protein
MAVHSWRNRGAIREAKAQSVQNSFNLISELPR